MNFNKMRRVSYKGDIVDLFYKLHEFIQILFKKIMNSDTKNTCHVIDPSANKKSVGGISYSGRPLKKCLSAASPC